METSEQSAIADAEDSEKVEEEVGPKPAKKQKQQAQDSADQAPGGASEDTPEQVRERFIFGALHNKGGKPSKAASREISKSQSVAADAGQLIQIFDDMDGLCKLSEQKVTSILSKINGRLTEDVVSSCVAEADPAQQGEGLKIVTSLREMKTQLSSAIPLVQSLCATQGEAFHFEFLAAALSRARATGLQITNAIDELQAVRQTSFLGESQDWPALVAKLHTGLDNVNEATRSAIREKGMIHSIESVMRTPLPSVEDHDEKAGEKDKDKGKTGTTNQKDQAGLDRCRSLQALVAEFKASPLSMDSSMAAMVGHLNHLDFMCNVITTEEPELFEEEEVQKAETARTCVCAKASPLQKGFYALPLGIWLVDRLQNMLAAFHSQKALHASLKAALLGGSEAKFYFFSRL